VARLEVFAGDDDAVKASIDRALVGGGGLTSGEYVEVLEELERQLGGVGVSLAELAELLLDGRVAVLELVRSEVDSGDAALQEVATERETSVAGHLRGDRAEPSIEEPATRGGSGAPPELAIG